MFVGTWLGLQLLVALQLPPLVLVQMMMAQWARLPKVSSDSTVNTIDK
jgi:hypothetical protein